MTLENNIVKLTRAVNDWYKAFSESLEGVVNRFPAILSRLEKIEKHHRAFDFVARDSEEFDLIQNEILAKQKKLGQDIRRFSIYLEGVTKLPLNILAPHCDIFPSSSIVFKEPAFLAHANFNLVHGGAYKASLGDTVGNARLKFLSPVTYEGAEWSKIIIINRVNIEPT